MLLAISSILGGAREPRGNPEEARPMAGRKDARRRRSRGGELGSFASQDFYVCLRIFCGSFADLPKTASGAHDHEVRSEAVACTAAAPSLSAPVVRGSGTSGESAIINYYYTYYYYYIYYYYYLL